MKRKITGLILLLFMICLPVPLQAKVKAPAKQCHAYAVMDAGSGEVLFGQNVNKKIYPASTAKLMTAIVCVENGNLNSVIKTKSEVVNHTTPGTYNIGIGADVKYTFQDLLHMSLMASSADATDSLAVGVFGSKKACVEKMNEKCRELHLNKTSFDNPVGSDIGAGFRHTYSTAAEMAQVCRYAMTIPAIRNCVSKAHYQTKKGGVYVNTTNWFLKGMAYYDRDSYRIIGSKSGTTNAAGHVFIATAVDKKGHELICAYFGKVSKESTFASIRSLFDYAFKKYKKGEINLTSSNYDVRNSEKYGEVYQEYVEEHCYPSGSNGLFLPNKAITRQELKKMFGTIDCLEQNGILTSFAMGNKNGTVTGKQLALLIQKLYPDSLSAKKEKKMLADCVSTEGMSKKEQTAYAAFLANGFGVDKSFDNPNQIVTRGQALLIADLLADYQMNYAASHAQSLETSILKTEETGVEPTFLRPTAFNKKWSDHFKKQKAEMDQKKKQEQKRKKAEQEKKRKQAQKEKQNKKTKQEKKTEQDKKTK